MTCKAKLEAYLRENRVPYQTQHHPVAFTAQEVAAAEHIPGRLLAKVVMVSGGGRMIMLAIPASYRVDLVRTAAALGARDVRLAREAEFSAAFPDCEVGAMPPFGNLYGVPVYVDRSLAQDETILVQAGTHTDTLSLRYADFERLVKPTVADFTRRPARASRGTCGEGTGMAGTRLSTFDTTLQKTHRWLHDLMAELACQDEQRAYTELRATLHALRDRLTLEEVAQLGAQLPMLVRGFYYEGWNPTGKPLREHHKEQFLEHIAEELRGAPNVDLEKLARAVFKVIARHISGGEADQLRLVVPHELRELWPA